MAERTPPTLRENLRQSIENPIQLDRINTAVRIRTEFTARDASPELRRKLIRRTLGFALLLYLLCSIPTYFPYFDFFAGHWAALAGVGVVLSLTAFIGWPKHWWQYAVYLSLPVAMAVLVISCSLLLMFIAAVLVTILTADAFAKQSLFIGTSAPFDQRHSQWIRTRWPKRFYSLTTMRGLELYGLGILLLLLTPWVYANLLPPLSVFVVLHRAQAFLIALLFVLFIPAALEVLTWLIYGRKPLQITAAYSAFRTALRHWFCYNPTNSQAPGLLQSPVGTLQARRWMLLGAVLLWAATINPLFSLANLDRAIRFHSQQKAAAPTSSQSPAANSHPTPLPLPNTELPPPEPYRSELPIQPQFYLNEVPAPSQQSTEPPELRIVFDTPPYDGLPVDDSAKPTTTPLSPTTAAPEQAAPKKSTRILDAFTRSLTAPIGEETFADAQTNFTSARLAVTLALVLLRELFLFALSLGFPLAFFYASTARLAASLKRQLAVHPDTLLSFGNWEALVNSIRSSDDAIESGSLLLGANASDNSPVLVPTKVFTEHAHILGDSGSGKTALGISILLNQLIKQQDCSIVVIDMKGDDTALLAGAQSDAAAAGKPFRWFTNELERSTYAFNPFSQEYFHRLSLYQRTDVITLAIGLQYGTDYGRGYYSDANAEYLYQTLKEYPEIKSFADLSRCLPTMTRLSRELRRDASHLFSIAQRLAATEALNVRKNTTYPDQVVERAIDFADLFRKPQVVYMHLPSSIGTTSSAEIARVALYSLIGSARCTPDAERKQVFVFIDEFQRIIANNLEIILQTARSMRIGVILANQSMLDLKRAGVDLTPAVKTNTRFKQVFACSNYQEMAEMIDSSGELLEYQRSFQLAAKLSLGLSQYTHSETISPRLRVNDLLLATDAPDQSVVQVRRGEGYAQFGGMPFIMRSTYHISPEEYARRKSTPWPEPTPGTILAQELSQKSAIDELPPVDPLPPKSAKKRPAAKSQRAETTKPVAPNLQTDTAGLEGLDRLFEAKAKPKHGTPSPKPPEAPSA